ncbi:hypothetical protein QYM36_016587 [Artemia franciscana]|uniref:Uncharacterized protein n=1 Tax=Artemia franciscana TaxID=6661 RepID=A0AA88HCX8_ARTSF|nr:hypothetical protein QYM36_016587 [Artemia franciscana]
MVLKSGDSRGMDGLDLSEELKVLRDINSEKEHTTLQCLEFLVPLTYSIPNAVIEHKIVSTVPIKVKGAGGSSQI